MGTGTLTQQWVKVPVPMTRYSNLALLSNYLLPPLGEGRGGGFPWEGRGGGYTNCAMSFSLSPGSMSMTGISIMV